MTLVIAEGRPPVDLTQATDRQVEALAKLGSREAIAELVRRRRR